MNLNLENSYLNFKCTIFAIENKIEIHDVNDIRHVLAPYDLYIKYMDKKDKKKEVVKDKYHTFLVFCSGSIIMSSSGPQMENVHNQFVKILLENRHCFEEKIL